MLVWTFLNSSWNKVQRYTDEQNVRKSQNTGDVDTVIKFLPSVQVSVHLLVNIKIFLRKTSAFTHDVDILMYVHSLYHAYP